MLLALAFLQGPAVLCQDGSQNSGQASASQDPDADVHRATVVVDGEALFSVRGVTARPADRRAMEIADRIRALAANRRFDTKSLKLEEHPGSTWIMADNVRVMALLDEDAAIEQAARATLAELYRIRIGEAIEAYRQDRRPGILWVHTLYALCVTAVLLLCAVAGYRIIALLRAGLERRYRDRLAGLQQKGLHLLQADQVWRALSGLLSFLWALGIALMVYAYLHYVLSLFPWTRGFGKRLLAIALDPLKALGLGLVGIIPNIVFLAILTLVTRYALRILRLFFESLAGGRVTIRGFDPEWATPTYRLVRLLAIALALIVAYPYIPGSGSDAFKGVSLFIGVIFSLGSSSLIGNFIAGYTMTYRRAFRVGDRVKIGAYLGDVERMRLLVTHLRTPKNEEVVVPNSTILNSEVINYSSLARERGLILHTTVGIGYETPWRQVEAMLLEAASRTEGVGRVPPPFVLHNTLGDFCVTYEINVGCDRPQEMLELYTALHRNILDLFNEYGVQIMTPAYIADPQSPKVVPKDQWYAAPARPPRSDGAAT